MKNSIIDSGNGSVPPLASGQRRPEVEEELRRWYAMNTTERQEALRAGMEDCRTFSTEALVHISRQAYMDGDLEAFNLVFEVFTKRATPLVLVQAWGVADDERYDQAQEVFEHVFKSIQTDKADFAEINFAAFARRKAISLYRAWKTRFENVSERIEPTDEFDPVDVLPARTTSVETQALLARSLDKLPDKDREIFRQYHRLGMTQEEIAEHHGITVRSVHNRLKAVKAELGFQKGGKNDC